MKNNFLPLLLFCAWFGTAVTHAASPGAVVAWGYNTYGQTDVPVTAQSGVIAIAAGTLHTVVLKNNGSVIAWGTNYDGEATVPVAALSGVVAIAAGDRHTVALKNDGSVLAWGRNYEGQTTVPVMAQSGVVAIGAGGSHTVALKNDGSVVAWGNNGSGQATVPLAAQSGVTALVAGGGHTVALKNDGSVIAWGYNGFGQTTVPVAAQSGVTAISAGGGHTVALKNGGVVGWGDNGYGQTTVPAAAQSGVIAIAAGGYYTVALKNDGSVVAWGNNYYGQTTVPLPAENGALAIAAGGFHTVALVVPTAPAINTPPTNQTVYAGQSGSFTVTATGYPLNYQWRKDGVELAGATSATYSLPFALTNHAGNYTVVVSNFLGSVTSAPPALLTVIAVAPEITTPPVSQTVNEWQSANFTVVATGHPAPNYQWRKDGVNIAGATSAAFNLSFVQTNQAGNYTVVASNPAGSVTSAPPAVLTVNPRPLFFTNFAAIEIGDNAPAFPYPSTITVSGVTSLIANINVTLYEMSHTFAADISVLLVGPDGQTVVLMSNAGGGSNLDDTTLVFDDGATSFLPEVSQIFSGTYKATDYYTNLVFYAPAPIRPYGPALSVFNGTDPNGVWKLFVIDVESDDRGIIAGGWAISMSGDDSPPALRFTWSKIPSPQFTNAPIAVTIQARDASNQIVTNFAGPVFLRDAATGGVVSNSILPSPNHTAGIALIPNSLGYAFTPGTNLTVRAVRHYFGTKVSIWTEAGVLLVAQPVTSVPGTWVETSLATPLPLTAGTRYRIASYIASGNSYYAFGRLTNFPNGTIDQSYSVAGDGFPTVTNFSPWFVDLRYTVPSVPVPIAPAISGDFTNGIWSGVVRSTSPATNLALRADDGAGHFGSSNPFHVVRSNQPPVIIAPPPNQMVSAGRAANFSLNVYGTPLFTYQWRRDGTNLSNGGRISGATNSILTISNVVASDAGFYSVLVSNISGVALSSSAALTINPVDHFSWSFIPSPVSTLTSFAVSVQARDFLNSLVTGFTGTVALSASLAGSGTQLPVSPTVSGAFVAGLWNGNMSVQQIASNVVLHAADGLGDIGLSAPFDVAQVAAFTLQPTNQNVLPGTNVTLTASAVGTGPVRYQWRFEGTNIPGATSASHSFINANLANHHGNFSCVATDDLSTAIGSNAFIYVLVKPFIVQHIQPVTVLQGASATFSLVATGAPPLSYRWVRNGGALPGATTSVPVLVITNVQAGGTVRVGVTNRASPAGVFSPAPNSGNNVLLIMLPDFDGDGMADTWEAQYGFSTNNAADALLDFDGDGVSNRDEYLAGTNPTNQLSYLKIDSVVMVGSGHDFLLLEFSAVSNKTYTLQYRDAFATAGWSNLLQFESAPTNRMVSLTNAMPPATPSRYYRLVTPRQGGE